MSSEMDKLLDACNDTFENTAAAPDVGAKLPEGEYIFCINDAEICKSKSSERIHIKMECQVADGEYESWKHWSYDLRFTDSGGAPDSMAMGYFKLACQTLGLGTPGSMEDARACVQKMPNRVFIGQIVQSGDFTNMRIRRLVHENSVVWVGADKPMPDEANRANDAGW